ncbi:MAG: CDP-glycerol glycerophosphotransferase family protein, partial [Microbacteriaceae bacterium]
MTTALIDEQAENLVVAGAGPKPASATLEGPRARVDARITGGGKTWKATFPLRVSRWGGAELPLPSGRYRLHVGSEDLSALEPESWLLTGLRVSVRGAIVTVAPPLDTVYETA